ncbi:MAG: cupin domain-containing protein [Acidimicrobiales bacterium]
MGTIDQDAFRREMEAAGATVSLWGNGPCDRYPVHTHAYRKVICCLAGSIVFHLLDEDVSLVQGARVVIDSGTAHSADVGPDGVRCAEAQFSCDVRPRGPIASESVQEVDR